MHIFQVPRPLNPQAQEWRPTPHPPPLHPLPLIQRPFKLLHLLPSSFYYNYHLSHTLYTHRPQHLYTISFPAPHFSNTATFPTTEEGTQIKNLERETSDGVEEDENKKLGSGAKCPTHPFHGQKKLLPPRLQRALRSRNYAKNQPPPPPNRERQTKKSSEFFSHTPSKQEWRQKNELTAASPPPHSSRTTVMIRNIPNQIRRSFLLKFLDHYCKIYSLEYDFLYLPVDFRKLGNLGYAFVNLTTAGGGKKLKKVLCNYRWRSFTTDDGEAIDSSKVVEITWARIQGKEALIRRFQNSRFSCTDAEFLPVVLDPPRNGWDPNPPPPLVLGKCRRPVQ